MRLKAGRVFLGNFVPSGPSRSVRVEKPWRFGFPRRSLQANSRPEKKGGRNFDVGKGNKKGQFSSVKIYS